MSNFNINIVFFGNGVRGEACLKQLIAEGKRIELIVGQIETSSLRSIAEANSIAFESPVKVNSEEFETKLKETGANLFILCGYNKILKSNILDIPKYKVINCHGGKLPEYRGTAPINWQLINGEEIVGFTILYADQGIDTGEILKEISFNIESDTTANDLILKSLEWFPGELVSLVTELESKGFLESMEQDESAAVHYTRRYPEDGIIDWKNMTDIEVHNLVRSLVSPYLGAFTYLNGEKIIVLKTSILEEEYRGVPGRVSIKMDNGAVVSCKNRALLIEKVKINSDTFEAKKALKIGQKFAYVSNL